MTHRPEAPEGAPVPDALEQLNRLVFQFRGRLQKLLLDAGMHVNPMELKALLHIAHHPGCTASDLARLSGRDKAQVTRLIQQLEQQGWVRRTVDERDRRSQRLEITPAGEAIHDHLRAARDAHARVVLSRLDPAEQARLAELLAKLNDPGA
jgi:DNA-binding MarR family transcriptional regulator